MSNERNRFNERVIEQTKIFRDDLDSLSKEMDSVTVGASQLNSLERKTEEFLKSIRLEWKEYKRFSEEDNDEKLKR